MRVAWPCRQSRSAGSSGKLAANDKKIKKDVEQKVLDGLGMTDAGQDADFVASSLTGSFGQFSQSRCTPWAQISTRPFCMISLGPSTRCHMPLPSACPPAPLPRGLMWSICGCGTRHDVRAAWSLLHVRAGGGASASVTQPPARALVVRTPFDSGLHHGSVSVGGECSMSSAA